MATAPTLHLLKLCVGAARVEDLEAWQAGRPRPLRHVTRMWPRRASEIAGRGSLYWVFSGYILARQPILGFDAVDGEDGVRRCGVRLSPEIVRTAAQPRRPFQGWRYLEAKDAPRDLADDLTEGGATSPELEAALAALGVVARRR
jgi:hypothetical protein